MANTKRLAELDGLRAVAALAVIFYHYFVRWNEILPYGVIAKPIAQFGFLGVNLFFIISGFVIFMSLERCASAFIFVKRRALRLVPAMLVCSIITYGVMRLIDTPFTELRREHWTGFLPSWTFTPPQIWQKLVPVGGWMDGVYWTLYIELKFYALAAFLYFFKDHKYFRIIFLAFIITGAVCIQIFSANPVIISFINFSIFPNYLPFFCAGMALYDVYERRVGTITLVLLTLSIALAIAEMADLVSGVIVAAFFAIFFIVIFRRSWVSWLTNPVLVAVGVASYPLYLIHQNVGIGLMSLVAPDIMQSWFYIIVTGVTAALILISLAIHWWVERPVEGCFKRMRRV